MSAHRVVVFNAQQVPASGAGEQGWSFTPRSLNEEGSWSSLERKWSTIIEESGGADGLLFVLQGSESVMGHPAPEARLYRIVPVGDDGRVELHYP